MRSRPLRAGFTLVELIAVIVILGLLTTLVSVNWAAILPKTQLHAAVRALSAALQSARSDAIARNAVFQIQYDVENHRYRTVTPFRESGGLAFIEEERKAFPWEPLPDNVRFAHIEIEGIEYSTGIVQVRFDPLGTATTHIVTLVQKPYDNYYTIEVQGLLGLIDYKPGQEKRVPPKESDFE